jgi:hypothetical protein
MLRFRLRFRRALPRVLLLVVRVLGVGAFRWDVAVLVVCALPEEGLGRAVLCPWRTGICLRRAVLCLYGRAVLCPWLCLRRAGLCP